MVWDSGPKPWTLDIQPQPAEQFDRVVQAEAPAFEQLEFVVEPFDETAGMSSIEIVENPVLPVMQGVDEFITTAPIVFGIEIAIALRYDFSICNQVVI